LTTGDISQPQVDTTAMRGTNHRRITLNFLTMTATGIVGLVISLIASVYIRRVLGPAAIGQIGWSLALVGYLGILVNPGLTTIGQRELAQHPGHGAELIAVVIILQTILAVVAYGAVFAIAVIDVRGHVVSILLLIQGLGFFLSAVNLGWVLQAHERMVAPSLAALAFNAAQLPLLFFLVHGPQDIYLYMACTLPVALASTLYNLWYFRRHRLGDVSSLRPTLKRATRLLHDAWPLALSQGAILIYFNADTIILGFVRSDATVGQYVTAYKLMLVSTAVTAALWNAYFPALARAHDSPAEAISLSRTFLSLLGWIGLPMAALGWALGRHVILLMYGAEYAVSGVYFEWLCLSVGFMFLNYGVVSVLVPWRHTRLQFIVTVSAAAANLGLNIVFIPLYGPWAAISTTIAAEVIVLGLGLAIRKNYNIHWHPILPLIGPPLICSIAVALAIDSLPSWLDRWWWLELIAGGLLLGGCMLFFKPHLARAAKTLLWSRGGWVESQPCK
jgi:O-antigen/teichoic acid export membrane protein